VLAALRAKGLKLESTAEEALKAGDDGHLVPLVLAFREASKRAQQAESLVGHIQKDGRIHGRFEPLGTATGRFSSKDPNLQNIGRGEMREAFTAPGQTPHRCRLLADRIACGGSHRGRNQDDRRLQSGCRPPQTHRRHRARQTRGSGDEIG
jgi:hypothetical protein